MANILTEMKEVFDPSPEQLEVLREIEFGNGHLVCRARAGTGKTTTLVEGIRRYVLRYPSHFILYCAFNTAIVAAGEKKLSGLSSKISCLNTHKLGRAEISRTFRLSKGDPHANLNRIDIEIQKYVLKNLAPGEPMPTGEKNGEEGDQIDTVSRWLLKNSTKFDINGLCQWVKDTNPYWVGLEAFSECAFEHLATSIPKELDRDECLQVASQVAYNSCVALLKEVNSGKFFKYDFSDMVWLPVRLKIVRPAYHLILIDEAQDQNKTGLELLVALCFPEGRIVSVGDDYQAIYAFRGADSEALSRLSEELGATECKMTYTFRCPKVVVEEANQYVQDFHSAPGAPEGERHFAVPRSLLFQTVAPWDSILCRNNAPLVEICLKLLAAGTRAIMAGRKIGKDLIEIYNKVQGRKKADKYKSMPEMLGRLEEWFTREKTIIEASGKNPNDTAKRLETLEDYSAIFVTMASNFQFPEEIKEELGNLFQDKKKEDKDIKDFVICSSIHKSKGLEWNNNFILLDNFGGKDFKGKRTEQQEKEEGHLCYVAITRTQKRLYYVKSKKDEAAAEG